MATSDSSNSKEQQNNASPLFPLRIALFGYGKMGRAIHHLALQHGYSVPVIVSPSNPAATHHSENPEALIKALSVVDVCIDFSVGEAVLSNLSTAIQAAKPFVIGTTNWQNQLNELRKKVRDSSIGVIYGANFAIGTQLFYQIVRYAAKRMRSFPQYDVSGIEWHHRHKVDSPSGTARELTDIVLQETPTKQQPAFDRMEGALPEESLPFVSLRSGYCPGMHMITFDGPHDTIELRHTTRSREGLAQGALMAGRWILAKQGLYSVEEMIHDIQKQEENILA